MNRFAKLLILLLCLDLGIVLLHVFVGQRYHFFHLDFEQNLPTFYQSAKLLIAGSIFLVASLALKMKKEFKVFLVPLSVFFIGLGVDELFQLHENMYRIFEVFDWLHPSRIVEASMRMGYRSSLWILYYLPFIVVFVFWSGYWLRYFQSKIKSNFALVAFSSLCFFTVLLAEVLSSTGTYSEAAYYWLITLEETAEMLLASSLVIVGYKTLHSATRER